MRVSRGFYRPRSWVKRFHGPTPTRTPQEPPLRQARPPVAMWATVWYTTDTEQAVNHSDRPVGKGEEAEARRRVLPPPKPHGGSLTDVLPAYWRGDDRVRLAHRDSVTVTNRNCPHLQAELVRDPTPSPKSPGPWRGHSVWAWLGRGCGALAPCCLRGLARPMGRCPGREHRRRPSCVTATAGAPGVLVSPARRCPGARHALLPCSGSSSSRRPPSLPPLRG